MSMQHTTRRQLRRAGLVVGLTVGIAALLVLTAPDRTPQLQAISAVRVAAVSLAPTSLQPRVEVTGRLQPANRAVMRFELSGQLAERKVEPGQAVAEGELLLRLADGDLRDALRQAEAQLAMQRAAVRRDKTLLDIARRDHALQKREVARLEKLGGESLVSASQLDQGRQRLLALESSQAQLAYNVETAQAQITISEANLARAQRNLERASLTAPFAGTVNGVAVEVGDYVNPNQATLELIDTRYVDLYVEVSGPVVASLALGQAVEVDVDGKPWQGTILALQNDPDPRTFTHALRIRLDGQDLQSGQLAIASLPLRPLQDVLAIPVSAVLRDEGQDYVFVIHDGALQRREISGGERYQDQVVVRRGLVAGEQIVARDVAALSDGQAVEVGEAVH